MKRTIYALLTLALVASAATSCKKYLELESKTNITNKWLYETPEGLSRAVVALYDLDRKIAKPSNDNNDCYVVQMLDYSTDLMVYRGGTAAALARLDNLMPNNAVIEAFWNHHYNIIGKANEIIFAAEGMDLEDPVVKRAWAEAKFFRGRAYFELYKRFERLYLNTVPTGVDNLQREFKPASREDIFERIRIDLDAAAENLAWETPQGASAAQHGRVTKASAKHVRAQFAMWENDWNTAIDACEEIFAHPELFDFERHPENVFLSGIELRSKEVLWAYQFSTNMGGGATGSTTLTGHRLGLTTLPSYHAMGKYFTIASDMGGYGWGRVYPNTYLLSLFDQEKDSRYTELICTELICNNRADASYGKPYDLELSKGKADYITNLHFFTKKYFDCWSNADQPDLRSSFKDLPVYRLGETALMCCEAYFHRDGGASTDALKYYNKTWQRAGNNEEHGPLTLDMILDEYARECNFEGVRWPLLKRLGILAERVQAHAGDSKTEDPYLHQNYTDARRNFVAGKHEVWPIPQSQIDMMGKSFPQHEVWN
ncbi:RagB/SusD family nutrient uptake outer membrane protein [uncultured Alistipes sp.]|uniref:RagB/SusD family nutrient uptake outer membrane protein n=1 Tax=uncultured Alistipes sp. TaxID=538949 RepID=UPI00265EC442|nr:RagB/SusD family nutrient uptake outer membrane protein [uncultured Alistipes sp.]MCX4301744.1 RagB/SusD family nutrient uptake outer membrane protein [Alistipes sp.]